MARRPKRTYNQATGKWEVEKLWDHRDDDGFYWKDGVQVDSSGVPIYDAQGNEQGAETPGSPEATSTPGTVEVANPKKQSGDDWGMEDPLEGSDEPDFANFTQEDWKAYNAQIEAESDEGPPDIPGEVDSSGFSSDFTDSGQQTSTDQPLSMEEIIYDQTGPDAPPDEDVPGVKGWKKKLAAYNQSGKGKGNMAADGSSPKSGTLRRSVRKLSPSLITAKA